MEDITASEMLLIRIVRENGRMANAIAIHRAGLAAKDAEIANLRRQVARQAEAIQMLSERVNAAEGRRDA